MGVIASCQRLPAQLLNALGGNGEQSLKVFATSGTMSSPTYVNLPGVSATSFNFTKYGATSDIRVDMRFEAFSTAASTGLRLGVLVNGTDYDIAFQYFTTANVYVPFSGFGKITGLAAGTYAIQARWRMTTGAGPINTNSGISELDMSAREVGV